MTVLSLTMINMIIIMAMIIIKAMMDATASNLIASASPATRLLDMLNSPLGF